MKAEQLYFLLGEMDEEAVQAAGDAPRRSKRHSLRFFAAACIMGVTFAGLLFGANSWYQNRIVPNLPDAAGETDSESGAALAYDNISIYYVQGNALCSTEEYLPCEPQEIFSRWKAHNGIGDEVQLQQVRIENNGTEYSGESAAEYAAGDTFILYVSVTKNLSNYFDAVPETLLLESLRQTLTGMGAASDYSGPAFDDWVLTME